MLGAGGARLDDTIDALCEHRVPVHAFVLENDYLDGGGPARLAEDLGRARRHALRFTPEGAER